MHPSLLLLPLLALSIAVARASPSKRQVNPSNNTEPSNGTQPIDCPKYEFGINDIVFDYWHACFPVNAPTNGNNAWLGTANLDAPCWVVQTILLECRYGRLLTDFSAEDGTLYPGTTEWINDPEQSPRDQQVCLCQSQWWAEVEGCLKCGAAHGASGVVSAPSAAQLSSLSSSYCAASRTPSPALLGPLITQVSAFPPGASSLWYSSTRLCDPLSSKTAVSLYFTPSVTGNAAWTVGEGYPDGDAWPTTPITTTGSSVNIMNGQIVATPTSTSAASTGSGTRETPAAEKVAVAGVVGLAAMVALL